MIVPRETMVVVRPEKVAKVSEVIVLAEAATIQPPAIGEVLAIGPKVREVAVGDTVHFERFEWAKAPGDCIILKESEILAKEETK
jgi:co-chaperonin GroES (HSP10)